MIIRTISLALGFFASCLFGVTSFGQEGSREKLRTVAELSEFQGTASGKEVAEFLHRIDALSDRVTSETVGKTLEGRELTALILSKENKNPLPLPTSDSRIVVLLLGGIHSGECDSKEGLLALLRELVLDEKKLDRLLEKLVIVVLPNFNADGNERVGLLHRPGQEGPTRGMGVRENSAGLDLNRDFVKLDSPEVRALVRTLDAWDVDVLMDCHTTNGSLHQYDMTYDIPHNPAANRLIADWLRNQFMPKVTSELVKQGLPTFYYGNFSANHDRWESYGHEARYSTEYMGIRGKIGILVESYSYASYSRRIEATELFVAECLKQLAEQTEEIQKRLLAGNRLEGNRNVPIQGRIVSDGKKHSVGGYVWKEDAADRGDKAPTDTSHQEPETQVKRAENASKFPTPRDRRRVSEMQKKDFELELWNVGETKLSVEAPAYYFLPYDCSWAAARLRLHGVRVSELRLPAKSVDLNANQNLTAERYRIEKVDVQPEYQAHRPKKITVEQESFSWKPQNGWLVSLDQTLAPLIVNLLEPHADDSLAVWNFFDPDVEAGRFFPVVRLNGIPSNATINPLPMLAQSSVQVSDMAKDPITLEKLYDPKLKVSYLSPPVPVPKWLPGDGKETLANRYLIQYDGRWHSVDCQSGAMEAFDRTNKLADAMSQFDGFDAQRLATLRRSIQSYDAQFENALIEQNKHLYWYNYKNDKAMHLSKRLEIDPKVPTLSPDGKFVAYVQDQNLWVIECGNSSAKSLTTDGGGEILNGYLDWVYQEEVYGRGQFKAYWWSPDSKYIAYLRLDESPVPTFLIDRSLEFSQTTEAMRYPKAGQPNPIVSLHVVEVETGETKEVDLGNYPKEDRLVVRVGWNEKDPSKLTYQVQNRIQSKLDVWSYDLKTSEQSRIVQEESKAWVDVIDEPRWLSKSEFLWLSDTPGGRRHLYRCNVDGSRKALTRGDWDVKELVWVSSDGSAAILTGHFTATANTDVMFLDCATEELTNLGTDVGTHRISVHPSGEFFFDTWSDLSGPGMTWLKDRAGNRIRQIGPPKSDRLDSVQTTPPELFQIKTRDGVSLQALLYKPTRFDELIKQGRLPVLIHVYGGPMAPTVENSFNHRNDMWHRYMAEQGIAVLFCDNRSALGRGIGDTWTIYRNLGEVELRDLEDAVSWLKSQEWVDSERLGIWGWSYGGYFTAYSMTHSNLFRAGIAGAPVTDWNNYDSIYTERFMSTPQLNPKGYEKSSVVKAAQNLSGRLMIIHGDIDDNVHMTNSLQLIHALQKAGKSFEMMIYPNNRHGITDPYQSYHQFQLMTDFFKRNLQVHQSRE